MNSKFGEKQKTARKRLENKELSSRSVPDISLLFKSPGSFLLSLNIHAHCTQLTCHTKVPRVLVGSLTAHMLTMSASAFALRTLQSSKLPS